MQHASEKRKEFSPFEYQCQVLRRRNHFPRANKGSTLENVLGTLRSFREEWHRNQQFLVPFDFIESTGLCPDVLVEISEYLSLNDAINAFSISILPLLRDAHSKVHLDNPSNRLLQIITEHLDAKQIASLFIADDSRGLTCDPSAFQRFDHLVSLTVHSPRWQQTIGRLLAYSPGLRRLSLWFPSKFDSDRLQDLRVLFSHSLTRLHIRCAGMCFGQSLSNNPEGGTSANSTITSFIFDSTYKTKNRGSLFELLPPTYSSVFNVPMKFIALLNNVRRVRLVITFYEIKSFLRVALWEKLIEKCPHLNRVILQSPESDKSRQEARNIEQTLRRSRPGIIFRIINT